MGENSPLRSTSILLPFLRQLQFSNHFNNLLKRQFTVRLNVLIFPTKKLPSHSTFYTRDVLLCKMSKSTLMKMIGINQRRLWTQTDRHYAQARERMSWARNFSYSEVVFSRLLQTFPCFRIHSRHSLERRKQASTASEEESSSSSVIIESSRDFFEAPDTQVGFWGKAEGFLSRFRHFILPATSQ